MLLSAVMNEKRRKLLEELPDFANKVDPWETQYSEFRTFLTEHANRYPDINSSDENEIRLAKWFLTQVQYYKSYQGLQQCEDICCSLFGSKK